MDMTAARLIFLLSALLGFCILKLLVCQPAEIRQFRRITLFFAWLLLIFLYAGFVSQLPWETMAICFVFPFIAGYMLSLHFFAKLPPQPLLPKITRSKQDPGLGHTAVIILAHGEPPVYDATAWLKQMQEFDEQKIPFVPYPFRPFFFHKLRQKYMQLGKSGHNEECFQIMKQIESEYRSKGDFHTKFYISYLESDPHPDAAVLQALNEGASRILICFVFVTLSSHTQEAIRLISPLKLEDYGVELRYTKPLYDSERLQALYLDEVTRHTQSLDKSKVGVLLVGHGQPVQWDREFYTQTQQEISFRLEVLQKLVWEGYSPENVKLAWMEFRDPGPADAIHQLISQGVTHIYYFSTIIGSQSMHAKYDVPALVQKTKLPSGICLQQLTAFEEKSGIVDALMERMEAPWKDSNNPAP